jgi:hypothetical protein
VSFQKQHNHINKDDQGLRKKKGDTVMHKINSNRDDQGLRNKKKGDTVMHKINSNRGFTAML